MPDAAISGSWNGGFWNGGPPDGDGRPARGGER